MPARPYWKGHMRLSLVSFAVALYPVVASSSRIAFHQLQKDTGCRIREKKVCGDSGAEVGRDDIVKGYEFEKDRYVVLDDADLDKVRLETRKTIELVQFFKAAEVDPIYYDKPYYVVPDGGVAEEAFAVVREALTRSGQAALGRVVLSGRERLTAVMPRDKGFVLHTLHPNDLVRKAGGYFADIEATVGPELADEVAVAEQLIARKTAPFDPKVFVDRYEEALKQIIDEKIKGEAPQVVEPATAPGNVVNLMEALKKSLGENPPLPEAGEGRVGAQRA